MILLFITGCGFAQNKLVNTSSADTLKISSHKEFGYSIKPPVWFKEKISQDNIYGGTFPAIDQIENAVIITGFKKTDFTSFEDFTRIYITGNTFGKPALFSKEHIWYGRNEYDLKKIPHGVSSRVFTFYKNKIYHNQFVLLETSNAFLFINFCATPETYDKNFTKFTEFLESIITE
ncbi:hypothetical protein Q766_01485 [Flavobacterium subsaxonicum WB 4.1-42 = DSM 21790]|uniref:PsbP C-terminal domain-containing protein n=1 Tax=Flavobacterium subsaxonicum WB 4.1-42 = DSM 21790 TaxID=1121898 RepID=A0A0A2MR50_9FLAO|nr:hypothetical protein Q766_01485 [Flavobacterium subsaxonicum WB 4.1-42 = DSM 21790]